MPQFEDMQFLDHLTDYIPTLAILDSLPYFNKFQKIQLKDFKGPCISEKCEKAFIAGKPVPNLVVQISKANNDVPPSGPWGTTLKETWVHIERVIAYWSRILKPAERNYSPTE